MKRIIVVGNGMVGHHFIDQLITQEKMDEVQITTFSEESRLAYDRVQLTKFFTGSSADDLMLTSAEYYDENGVHYFVNDRVESIDKENKFILTAQGRKESYDKLILATGSFPFVPPIPGKEQDHCLVYRTIEDLEAITASAKDSKVGVVVGGGLLGLEAANAVKNLGLETNVVEFAPRLMAVQVDDGGGEVLRTKIEELGVNVHTGKNTTEIVPGESCRYRMNFADGTHLETDMIIFSAGIRPQDALARQHDIQLGERGGISINDHCQTSDPDIYAIGECALWNNTVYGLVAPGYSMAKAAVSHIIGDGSVTFKGADMSTKLKLMGVDVASIGDAHGAAEDAKSYSFIDEGKQIYKKIVVNGDNNRLLGAVMVGDAADYGNWLQIFLNDMDLPTSPENMLIPPVDGEAPIDAGMATLPDTAVICSCFDVTKGDICQAVRDGATNLADVKAATKASSGCGGCAGLVTSVMNAELASLGVEVSTDLCEHFAYTRQDLVEIVRVKKHRTFEEVLSSHGKGGGCAVCRQAVGSILASYGGEYVLSDDHLAQQDTNDAFLGNIQKDGTYSVIPRVAGGEITPEKLVTLGQVASEYDLYTKITGAQRIGLFGAQLHQIPEIWGKLIEAGFETGQAYGKSLRAIKSCMGSTWCRYGVQDSVAMGVLIENRYKGIRTPHKFKGGVSGCTRECAEAQGKDVGVIATEEGWGLYVCGNGGMRPRHADLLATDLDDETLIKYIDRFLMFYIRTADKLQRTSVWLENLEGGIEHLKEVIIDDKLGICDELEADMQRAIDAFHCEWKKTLETPLRLERFKHFINSDETDDNLLYVRARGQRQPANEQERIEIKELS